MRRYDYDRLPTTGERIGGFVAALVLFLLSIATVVAAAMFMLSPRGSTIGPLVAMCSAALAAAWSLSLMGRILYGCARRPGFVGLALMGAITLAMGVASLIAWVTYDIAEAWKLSVPALGLGYAFLRQAALKRNGSA